MAFAQLHSAVECLIEHGHRHRVHESVLLHSGKEVFRFHQAVLGVIPTNKGFYADDYARSQIDLGLIVNAQFAFRDRSTQLIE